MWVRSRLSRRVLPRLSGMAELMIWSGELREGARAASVAQLRCAVVVDVSLSSLSLSTTQLNHS